MKRLLGTITAWIGWALVELGSRTPFYWTQYLLHGFGSRLEIRGCDMEERHSISK